MCTEKECLSIKNEQCLGYLCSVSTDEMALKPEPEYLAYEDVTKISVSSSEDIIAFLQTRQFVTQAREVRMASLDNKVDFPIGVFYCGNKGGAHYIEELCRKIMDVAQRCYGCLETDTDCKFHCDNCFSEEMVCNLCSTSGYTDWHPLLRPCSQCLRENIVCTRLLPLVWSTDCDPKQKTFMNTMLADREKYPYQLPNPDCPHNIKSVRSAEFWHWIDIDGYLVNVRLLLLLRREDEGIKKCVSLKALRILDRMDVETALEIHRKEVQDSIPDEFVSTTLVPELEFKRWKKNGLSLLSYRVGLTFSPKHSRLYITDRLLHAIFIIDMHYPANVTLIAGEPGHTNGRGSKARFKNPAGVAVREEELYVCDQGNGIIRVVNMGSLFCHASRIGQEDPDAEESQSEEEDFAIRRIRKVSVHNLSLISEENEPDLVSPFTICAATKDNFELYVSDVRLSKVFSITNVVEEETNYIGELKELLSFDSSTLLISLALTRDEQHLLVGDGNGSNVHVCQVRGGLKTKTISNIPGPTGIAVIESGTVFVSSIKEYSLFSLKEGDLFRGTDSYPNPARKTHSSSTNKNYLQTHGTLGAAKWQ